MASDAAKAQKQNEKILGEFQTLRNEQRNIANSLNALEMDLKEHKTVIETLKNVDENRKCFRLIGGVLCERTVKEVLPQLIENNEFLQKTIVAVTDQLAKKGQEINKFKEQHNITIRGYDPPAQSQGGGDAEKPEGQDNRTVLVVNN